MKTFSFVLFLSASLIAQTDAWWSADVQAALTRAGEHSPQIEQALRACPEAQRKGMAYLVGHMPRKDLQSLKAEFLLENVALAYRARHATTWAEQIPESIFLDAVLPYANVDETRESWRKTFMAKFAPLVASCQTAGEAAQLLNRLVFRDLSVRYSTKRRRANQSPSESIKQGLASCTGLSILLSDACRSVGVPARLAGIPAWVNKPGNHTWVEIWDGGWHFTGAAEPSDQGLDRGWFAADAALAKFGSRMNAIYAVSYKPTGKSFPMVWAPGDSSVHAVDVTERYTTEPAPVAHRLMIRVLAKGERVVAAVRVSDPEGLVVARGVSKDEGADTNDFLTFELASGESYLVTASREGQDAKTKIITAGAQRLVELVLEPAAEVDHPSDPASGSLREALSKWFAADGEARTRLHFARAHEELLRNRPQSVRATVWDAYCADAIHRDLRADFEKTEVRFGSHTSPYTLKQVGEKPSSGWPLVIAMHGGGGAPQRINDSQWRIMQRYYRDHPEVTGYLYLALRAPNNSWNGFYDDYVYPLIANLIRQQLLCSEVDSDRVFLIGYSHGGYGAFAIGPKMPDHFAAIHASAAAPTDGQTSTMTLRTTPFTFMIGERDLAYGRLSRCQKYDEAVRALRGERTDIYPVTMQYQEGFGHGGLPDRDRLRELLVHRRNATPTEISWQQTDTVIRDFFWLEDDHPVAGRTFEARFKKQRLEITTTEAASFAICGDSRWLQWGEELKLIIDGKETLVTPEPSLTTLCEAMLRRGDLRLCYTWRHVIQR